MTVGVARPRPHRRAPGRAARRRRGAAAVARRALPQPAVGPAVDDGPLAGRRRRLDAAGARRRRRRQTRPHDDHDALTGDRRHVQPDPVHRAVADVVVPSPGRSRSTPTPSACPSAPRARCPASSGSTGRRSPRRASTARSARRWSCPGATGRRVVAVGVGDAAEPRRRPRCATPRPRSPAPPPSTARWRRRSPTSARVAGRRRRPGRRRGDRPRPLPLRRAEAGGAGRRSDASSRSSPAPARRGGRARRRAGRVTAGAAQLARDLANTPPGHLTATRMADVAMASSARRRSWRSRCSTRTRSPRSAAAGCSASTPAAPSRRA